MPLHCPTPSHNGGCSTTIRIFATSVASCLIYVDACNFRHDVTQARIVLKGPGEQIDHRHRHRRQRANPKDYVEDIAIDRDANQLFAVTSVGDVWIFNCNACHPLPPVLPLADDGHAAPRPRCLLPDAWWSSTREDGEAGATAASLGTGEGRMLACVKPP